MSNRIKAARQEIKRYKAKQRAAAIPPIPEPSNESTTPVLNIEDLNMLASAGLVQQAPQDAYLDGNKFYGGFGSTQIYLKDYWELRAKSSQLFEDNLYAKGIVRRLVTNEINTGLSLEATPEESILGLTEDSLTDWSEDVEVRFGLWASNPSVCDFKKKDTFAKIQRNAKMEAYIAGDVLVVIRRNKETGMPSVQLVPGNKVRSMGGEKLKKGHTVKHGVELDPDGRQVGYWIKQDNDRGYERLPAMGNNGEKIAFLLYGCDHRLDDIRGEPLLTVVLQSLREIDRYRDSVQRKAVVTSLLAMFIKKEVAAPGSLPMTGGAVKKGQVTITDQTTTPRQFNVAEFMPGTVVDELQVGETPVPVKADGTDLNFPEFEEAIIQAVAWSLEIPPEILRLSFSSNYSASQAAINEFKMYLNLKRTDIGSTLCSPVYIECLLSLVMLRRVKARGLVESWKNPADYETFGAWVSSDWSGAIKPSTDMLKTTKAYSAMVANFQITDDRASREVSGQKFTHIVKRTKITNQMKADAMRPLLELKQEFGEPAVNEALAAFGTQEVRESLVDEIKSEVLEEIQNESENE